MPEMAAFVQKAWRDIVNRRRIKWVTCLRCGSIHTLGWCQCNAGVGLGLKARVEPPVVFPVPPDFLER